VDRRKIYRMRAAFVLALILNVAAPPDWPVGGTATPTSAADSAMASPAGALCQLVRDSAKAEKTFSNGWFAAATHTATLPAPSDADDAFVHASQLRSLAIDSPPLAPRPPPLD
jgi:hypothetical protein